MNQQLKRTFDVFFVREMNLPIVQFIGLIPERSFFIRKNENFPTRPVHVSKTRERMTVSPCLTFHMTLQSSFRQLRASTCLNLRTFFFILIQRI